MAVAAGVAAGVAGATGVDDGAPALPPTPIPGSTPADQMLVIGETYVPGVYESGHNLDCDTVCPTGTPGFDLDDMCDFEVIRVAESNPSTETVTRQHPNPNWNRRGTATVTLLAGDRFRSSNCSEWHYIGASSPGQPMEIPWTTPITPPWTPPTTNPATSTKSNSGSLDGLGFGS